MYFAYMIFKQLLGELTIFCIDIYTDGMTDYVKPDIWQ